MSANMDGPVRPETGEVQTWRYSLPNVKGEGWVIAFLDSTGCFTALSDWGDVAYRWNKNGWGPGDFREFLLRCDDYYLTSKFGRGRKKYDSDATVEGIKAHILERRRDDFISKEEAREEWDRLDTYDDLSTEFDFSQWYTATKLDDPGEFYREDYVSDVTAFIEHAMPRLREAFKADLMRAA